MCRLVVCAVGYIRCIATTYRDNSNIKHGMYVWSAQQNEHVRKCVSLPGDPETHTWCNPPLLNYNIHGGGGEEKNLSVNKEWK